MPEHPGIDAIDRQSGIGSVAFNDFVAWFYNLLIDFFRAIQMISTPIFLIMFGIGGIVLILGFLFSSSKLKGAGGGTLIISAIAYILVMLAPKILAILEDIVKTAPVS